ncbi:hypothetical protein C9374_009723 [Naegleria lovaniensis]|uniref:Uncharacterized protein n=1 Tax=Naegleria lovaniensis TaxID=51637 RepID=A0AA88H5H1_NAELO|nr:uncharacterized protein C9374_009723 [Naegleria lovaniensis]KAG2393146.1 hypothetical protein C9374_009723 [Naegleria lovaniensis]
MQSNLTTNTSTPTTNASMIDASSKKKPVLLAGDFASTGRIGISCGAYDTPLFQEKLRRNRMMNASAPSNITTSTNESTTLNSTISSNVSKSPKKEQEDTII